ncbi:hypothetical protein [uncultured Lactobacillus sp.]|uniref:hypothetical protein n=1 Tax=uncultured Lactobacillus sp. TaxID=153152 RepID=UPI00272D990C|nr:hypothetical protein [uncultured Lactobacillus sp.]
MRYDTKVNFFSNEEKKYNPRIHQYEGGTKLVKQEMANVTDLGLTRQVKIFGTFKEGRKTIRLMNKPPEKWSFLMLENDKNKYFLLSSLGPSKGYALIVGENNAKN